MPQTAQNYFSAFQANQKWIYHNQDSTKIDTLRVENYLKSIKKDEHANCTEFEHISFELNSKYFNPTTVTAEYASYRNCNESYFSLSDTSKQLLILYASDKKDTLYSQNINKVYTQKNLNINNVNYKNVLNYNNMYWFAQEIGLVQYLSSTSTDTFKLKKHLIIK